MYSNFNLIFKICLLVGLLGNHHTFAQTNVKNDSVLISSKKKTWWAGIEVLRSAIISRIDYDEGRVMNTAIEPYVEYGIGKHWRAYLNVGYTSWTKTAFRNLHYWNESFAVKPGLKYTDNISKPQTSIGVGLLYYNFHETGKYVVGGSYYGITDVKPYNIRFSGIGIEVPMDFWIYVTSNLAIRLDFSISILYNPGIETKFSENPSSPGRHYVAGAGFTKINKEFLQNINLGLSLNYRIDW